VTVSKAGFSRLVATVTPGLLTTAVSGTAYGEGGVVQFTR
jgi:hypothetical protein